MGNVVRLSLSLEETLYERLESLVSEHGYANRSEFVRDMIRQRVVQQEWQAQDKEVVATITLVYDHHQPRLSEKLTDLQHDYHSLVLATTHVHLDQDMCAEMTLLKGPAYQLRQLTDRMQQQRGVLHAGCSTATTGHALA